MGWLYTDGQTRKELIQHLTAPWKTPQGSTACLAHCTRGNTLWMVIENYRRETGTIHRYIICVLMQNYGGWGYKDMDESAHPYYYTCPLKYLRMVPQVQSHKWRRGVLMYHKELQLKRWAKKRATQTHSIT